jgi:hypothetical protein
MTEQVALHVPLKPFVADGVVHGELIRLENHYDGELPDPFRITRAWLWADGAGALDSTVIGNLAVGIDPGGQYLSVNGQVEKEWPRTIKSLCVWEIFAGGSRQAILDHYPPIAYRGSAGDIVITAPEVFGNGSMAGAFLILFAESETGDLPVPPASAYAYRGEMTASTANNPVACVRSKLPGPSAAATEVRVHIQSHMTQAQIEFIDKMSIGVQDGVSSTTTDTPVRLTFGTRDGYRLAARQGVWSDWVPLPIMSGQNVLVSSLISSAVNRAWSYRDGSLPSWVSAADSVNTAAMQGTVMSQSSRTHVVDKVQFR